MVRKSTYELVSNWLTNENNLLYKEQKEDQEGVDTPSHRGASSPEQVSEMSEEENIGAVLPEEAEAQTQVENNTMPDVAEAMYPAEDDHRTFVVDLELDFCHGTVLVKDGIVIKAPQMLKWTQEYPDGNARQTPFADVMEWYQRPNKTDDEGNKKNPEYINSKVISVLNR